jgi:hypothetical protein
MEEAYKKKDKDALLYLYNKVLPNLAVYIHQNLSQLTPLFHDFFLEKVVDTWTKGPDANADTPISIEHGNVQQMGLRLRLEGFQRAGIPPFDVTKVLLFKLSLAGYTVGPDKEVDWIEKHHYRPWTESETRDIAKRWCDELLDEIMQRLESLT